MDTEEEKGFFERVYGSTIESLKDPETYTRLLNPSSYGDLYEREAEGLEFLYDFLGGPDRESLAQTYGTYGDTKSEIFTNPDFYKDQGRFIANTGYDLAQFYGGLGKGMFERLGNIDFYNPFGEAQYEKGMNYNPESDSYTLIPGVDFPEFMTPYGRYAMDAGITGILGSPSFIEDNPLAAEDSYLMDSMQQNASMQAGKYANDMLTDDVYSNLANESYAELPYEEWIKTNRNTNPEKYDDQIDQIFQNKVNNFFNQNFQPFFQKSVNDQMMNRFGINMNDQIFSEEGGLKSLNQNYKTEYDASQGRPRFEYETIFPQAYYDLSDMAEIPLDIASTAGIIKYGPKLLNISAKQFKKQPDSFNKAIEEYLRD